MFYALSQYLIEQTQGTDLGAWLSGLRVFRYITFRTAGAAMTGLLLSLLLGRPIIAWLRRMNFGEHYVAKAEQHGVTSAGTFDKRGTPTMGGVLIVLVVEVTVLLWTQVNYLVALALLPLFGLAVLGFFDDYTKVTRQTSDGVRAKVKLVFQLALGVFIAGYLWAIPETRPLITEIMVPFEKHAVLTGAAGVGMVLTVLTIMGSSNAVNLTDGLDGLAAGCTLIVTAVFIILTYVAGHARFAAYLQVPYIAGSGELTVVCAAIFGASLGFLWFNCYPAEVFMGDTGSLALGGVLGIIAVLIHQPFVLFIAGGVFVLEALSVMLQVGGFKLTRRLQGRGRRVLLMAPLHHHFQKLGWPESKVTTRFYIVGVLCGVAALATLKLR
jgi:phospho-N-acetylmuramoyl-pentapeptide-transferase